VAVCLGADFVKVNAPDAPDSAQSAQLLRQATMAAGNTKVICSGGPRKDDQAFLQDVYNQIHTGGAAGAAIGRNIHQKSTQDAIKFCNALAAIIMDDVDVTTAGRLLK
jgi:DhnA family fructose-bisphosphate aldolase class Ia